MVIAIFCSAPFIILAILPLALGVNFDTCLAEVRSGKWGVIGGTDIWGNPVSNISTTMGVTYDLCVRACGAGSVPPSWTTFFGLCGSWLLPWLALVPQLPFGADNKFDNLMSILLTVGSPTLAAYSLALTVLNGRWIVQCFASFEYPNTRNAARILISMQQSPLVVTTDSGLLSSLVVLPENDRWWGELVTYTHSWSISAALSIAWVIVAYFFTIISSFTLDSSDLEGQGVGIVWLWLLPVVASWLRISPKCDSKRLHTIITQMNAKAYVATSHGDPVLANSAFTRNAISLALTVNDSIYYDQHRTAPIYNYARLFSWSSTAHVVSEVFGAAYQASLLQPVNPETTWKGESPHHGLDGHNRTGTREQVDTYCIPPGRSPYDRHNRWGPAVWQRLLIASFMALLLQWTTTGIAIILQWFTPTRGLGCYSASYLLYGCLSTIVWILLVLSSILAHCSTTAERISSCSRLTGNTSVVMRRLAKVIASCNAVWIVITCLFQFGNLYKRCYCESSIMTLGSKAYTVIDLSSDLAALRDLYIGGLVIAAGCAMTFAVFVNLLSSPPSPEQP